jgi:uncharacterized membrane protein
VIFNGTTRPAKLGVLIVLIVVMVLAEFNALYGTTGPGKKVLSTLKGTFWAGFVLTAILYFSMEIMFP